MSIIRLIPTSLDVLPTKRDTYLLAYNDDLPREILRGGEHYAYQYTEGGWNTHMRYDGTVFDNAAITVSELKRNYKYWLRPVEVDGDSWTERLATLLEEVTAEKIATVPSDDEEDMKLDYLEELETHLMRALEFAEGVGA